MKKLLLAAVLLTTSLTGFSQAYNMWEPIYNASTNTVGFSIFNTQADTFVNYGNVTYINDVAGLTQASNGLIYGAEYGGGKYNYGTLFSYDIISGQDIDLLDFDSTTMGGDPVGTLVQAPNGLLYGLCSLGGKYSQGTMFSYNITTGKYSVVINFDSATTGQCPNYFNGLTLASNGLIYGVTAGINYNSTVSNGSSFLFSYNPTTGQVTSLFSLEKQLGIEYPYCSLVQASNGLLYGTADGDTGGGNYIQGAIFSYNPVTQKDTIEYSFDSTDVTPASTLVQSKNGLLYGYCPVGLNGDSANPTGCIYSFDPVSRIAAIVLSFDTTNTGFDPQYIYTDTAGMIYCVNDEGGTSNLGTIIEYNPYASTYTVIFNTDSSHNNFGQPTFLKTYNIAGIAYNDVNATCTYASNDPKLQGVPIMITNNLNSDTANLITATGGTFSDKALYGTKCTVTTGNITGTGLSLPCPTQSKYTDSITTATNNLAMKCSNGFDLTGNLSLCVDTPGFSSAAIQACIFNNRCQPVNGQLKLIIDPNITVTATVAGTSPVKSGDTLIWSFDTISLNTKQNLCVSVTGTVGAIPAGDSVFTTLIVTPIAGDSVPGNNQVTYWVKPFPYNCIGLPYDPNNKSVTPIGDITSATKLTYAIHFQNTGTAPAKNVVVIDTLNQYVDISSLRLIESSSPVSITVSSGNIVSFTFNNINLPDVGTSKTASIGSFEYSVSPVSNAPLGTNITNNAGIYFDANPVVLTNTTSNTINSTITSINQLTATTNGIACFPNPFSTSASVVFNNSTTHYLELDDITGRKLRWIKCQGNQYELTRGNLSAGIYILRAFNTDMSYSSYLKIVVQ